MSNHQGGGGRGGWQTDDDDYAGRYMEAQEIAWEAETSVAEAFFGGFIDWIISLFDEEEVKENESSE